ncbi:hypothetical protein HUG15_18505 [Salicibibacter cibarius]|uniref:Pyrroline-5-carboxylate reductase catalytic N-terminal domain-containing protein n=1 Tax=Salicibibacter cibarius TaxID=2743000 RepID=A0A7T6Z5X3_9BACI|nr:hypothetical protein [Salicibibacter cibarius]QQK77376.1 hypothetical protein HUG15_18505 [Salicibibacter cibarius]
MLIIGYGTLARAIIQRVSDKTNTTIDVYNRTKSVVDVDPACNYVPPEKFHRYANVLVALPASAYEGFFRRWAGSFPEDTCFFYCATKIMQTEMRTYVKNKQSATPCKLAGHAEILRVMGEGAFAFENEENRVQFDRWSDGAFQTVSAKEEHVLEGNRVATEESLRALVTIEEKLQQAGVPQLVIESVNASIPGGIAQAHKNDTHGHFAKDILKKWQGDDYDG